MLGFVGIQSMKPGAFESMTDLAEWREMIEDWRNTTERTKLSEVRRGILDGDDPAQVRRIARASGYLEALDSFDHYIKRRIERERGGGTRPLPKGLSAPLRRLTGRP